MKTVVILAALAAALSACGPASSSSTAAPTSGAAATAAPTSTATALPTSTAVPAGCSLTAAMGAPNSYTGHTVLTVILTNTGTTPCPLNGYPTVVLTGTSGPVTSLTEQNGRGQAATATPSAVSVAAGAKAQFIIELTDIDSGTGPCPIVTGATYELPSSAGGGTLAFADSPQPCPPTFAVGAVTTAP